MSIALDDRTQFIGGSDIAGILGLSRWSTPLSVWAEKTGNILLKPDETLPQKLGKRLEDVVADLFTEETGLRVQRVNERKIHPRYPHFRAQVDRIVVGADETVECKTTSAWKAKEWKGDEIPQEYICQAMWGLAVTGRKRAHVPVLIGNQDFRIQVVNRDPVMIAEMLRRANVFWTDHVLARVMPGQISALDTDTLSAMFPSAEPGRIIDLGDDGARLVESRNALYQDCINIEKQVEQVENELRALIKDAEGGRAGKYAVLWKNTETSRCDVKLLRQEAPELYGRYIKVTKGRRLTIRESEERKAT